MLCVEGAARGAGVPGRLPRQERQGRSVDEGVWIAAAARRDTLRDLKSLVKGVFFVRGGDFLSR